LAAPGSGVAEVLGTLTSSAVGGLASVPPFAVVVLTRAGSGEPATAHVVARGDGLTVTIETASGAQTVSGAGVISWTERVVEGVTAVEIATGVPGFGSFADGLPVESGVVLAGVVRHQVVEPAGDAGGLSAAGPSAAAAPAASEPVPPMPTPVPAPEPTPVPEAASEPSEPLSEPASEAVAEPSADASPETA